MARLTPDIIVSRAIEVMGTHGCEQFSVRKLGEAIDADPTAIYRHFRSKDELLRAMGDRVLAGVVDDLPIDFVARLHPRAVHPDPRRNLAQPGVGNVGARRSPAPRQRAADHRDDARLGCIEAGFGAEPRLRPTTPLIELTIGSAAIDATWPASRPANGGRTYEQWRSDYAAPRYRAFPHSVSWPRRCTRALPTTALRSRSIGCSTAGQPGSTGTCRS